MGRGEQIFRGVTRWGLIGFGIGWVVAAFGLGCLYGNCPAGFLITIYPPTFAPLITVAGPTAAGNGAGLWPRGQSCPMRNNLTRLIAVTIEGPVRPLTSESQQIQGLAGNVHNLAVDPTPRTGRDWTHPAMGERILRADDCLPATLSAKDNQGQWRISCRVGKARQRVRRFRQ